MRVYGDEAKAAEGGENSIAVDRRRPGVARETGGSGNLRQKRYL